MVDLSGVCAREAVCYEKRPDWSMLGRKSKIPAAYLLGVRSLVPLCYVIVACFTGGSVCQGAVQRSSLETSQLVALAAGRFPNLTSAERAMLWFSDIENVNR